VSVDILAAYRIAVDPTEWEWEQAPATTTVYTQEPTQDDPLRPTRLFPAAGPPNSPRGGASLREEHLPRWKTQSEYHFLFLPFRCFPITLFDSHPVELPLPCEFRIYQFISPSKTRTESSAWQDGARSRCASPRCGTPLRISTITTRTNHGNCMHTNPSISCSIG